MTTRQQRCAGWVLRTGLHTDCCQHSTYTSSRPQRHCLHQWYICAGSLYTPPIHTYAAPAACFSYQYAACFATPHCVPHSPFTPVSSACPPPHLPPPPALPYPLHLQLPVPGCASPTPSHLTHRHTSPCCTCGMPGFTRPSPVYLIPAHHCATLQVTCVAPHFRTGQDLLPVGAPHWHRALTTIPAATAASAAAFLCPAPRHRRLPAARRRSHCTTALLACRLHGTACCDNSTAHALPLRSRAGHARAAERAEFILRQGHSQPPHLFAPLPMQTYGHPTEEHAQERGLRRKRVYSSAAHSAPPSHARAVARTTRSTRGLFCADAPQAPSAPFCRRCISCLPTSALYLQLLCAPVTRAFSALFVRLTPYRPSLPAYCKRTPLVRALPPAGVPACLPPQPGFHRASHFA